MRKLLFIAGAILVLAGACICLRRQDAAQDEKLCAIMERQSTFDGETVDMLWHWRQEGRPSARFQALYEEKIANLPGWRP